MTLQIKYDLRMVKYKRSEYGGKAMPYEENLLIFVYDIPYFSACGIFPPFHVINQIFLHGGCGGGMSPGTEWTPFQLTRGEYDLLSTAVRKTPVSQLRSFARFADLPMKFDNEFNDIKDQYEWAQAMCNKHRQSWHEELGKRYKINKKKGKRNY